MISKRQAKNATKPVTHIAHNTYWLQSYDEPHWMLASLAQVPRC